MRLSQIVPLLLVAVLTGCGGGRTTGSESPGLQGKNALKIKVTGACKSEVNGGVLYFKVHGFTPNKTFTVNAWYPDSSPYRYLHHTGGINSRGKLVMLSDRSRRWGWACGDGADGKPDPPGRYTIQFKDKHTGRSTPAVGHKHAVRFRILPAR